MASNFIFKDGNRKHISSASGQAISRTAGFLGCFSKLFTHFSAQFHEKVQNYFMSSVAETI